MRERPVIFLSYAQEDESEVERLWRRLRSDGLRPWMAKKDIVPGEDWERSIWRAVHAADFFVVCMSSHSVSKRGFLQKEIKQALEIWKQKLEDDIYLIPARLDGSAVPDGLQKFQWVDLFHEDGYPRLFSAISEGLERLRGTAFAVSEFGSLVTKDLCINRLT